VASVQDSVSFVDGKTLVKDGVYPTLIENVFDKEVLGGVMMNASMIISRDMRPKLLCVKVDEEIIVLGSSEGMRKRRLSGKSSLMGKALASKGKIVMSSARKRDFLLLGLEKSRLYSWRMTIHQENPLICCRLSKYYMGLEFSTTLVV
jgi:hypothetical protein